MALASLGVASAIVAAVFGAAQGGTVGSREALGATASSGLVIALAAACAVVLAHEKFARWAGVADKAAAQASLGVTFANASALHIFSIGWTSFELAVTASVTISTGALQLRIVVARIASGDAARAIKARARLLTAGRAVISS